MELGHAGMIQILAAAHGVGEMDAPVVALIDIAHRGRDAAFGHHGVGFAQERFAHDSNFYARGRSFHCRAQSGATRTDDQHVVFVCLIFRH